MEIVQSEKKLKDHKVFVGSGFGKKIGFTPDNFSGTMPEDYKKKHGRKGTFLIKRQDIDCGSHLWLEEKENRVLLLRLIEINPNVFGTMDLMCAIALQGYNCAMIRPTSEGELKHYGAPYVWTRTMENYQNNLMYIYTMTKEDILEKLLPIVEDKIRFSNQQMIDIITKPLEENKVEEIELATNFACKLVNPQAPYVDLRHRSPEQILDVFQATQCILYNYYFQNDVSQLPPNPKQNDCVQKVINEKLWNFTWLGAAWEKTEQVIPEDQPNRSGEILLLNPQGQWQANQGQQ